MSLSLNASPGKQKESTKSSVDESIDGVLGKLSAHCQRIPVHILILLLGLGVVTEILSFRWTLRFTEYMTGGGVDAWLMAIGIDHSIEQ